MGLLNDYFNVISKITHLTTSFRYKRSKLERQMNLEVVWCVLILIALCFFGAVGSAVWLGAFDEYAII